MSKLLTNHEMCVNYSIKFLSSIYVKSSICYIFDKVNIPEKKGLKFYKLSSVRFNLISQPGLYSALTT